MQILIKYFVFIYLLWLWIQSFIKLFTNVFFINIYFLYIFFSLNDKNDIIFFIDLYS